MKTTYDANILTYCQWRDDLTMEQSPFCHVDNLIFCCLAYLNWDGIAEGFTVSESVSLRDAAKLWESRPAKEQKLRVETDRELLRRLARWDRLRTVCSVMLVLGFVAGGIVWWKSGDIRWGLLALFILLAVGIIGLCRCDSRQRKLIWEQMGDFFRSETEQAFGPDTKLPELVIDEADIRRSQMIDRHWEEFQIKNYRQGVHQGVRFSAANVELTHNFEEHVGRDVNDTMTRSVKAFGGVWLICETERQAPEGGYLYRREDQAYGRDALELVPLLETLGRPAAVRWEENRLELALESTLPVMDLPVDINVRDLNALRRSYLVSLRYLQGIIEALRRCGALFAEHEKEQTNG